ncbi:MAG TPA: outer membrane lipoprotein carrier protein LolA [Syntrophaceae bacterium]|jgi:outer membrane lipoprotein-sorting protein|nr:outer membrane lipoprotein carrier protein LolA [Syntrophaceae bacterium]
MEYMMENRAKRYVLLVGILCSCAFILAWVNTWEDIRRESAKITSVSAQFSQQKHMQILTKPLVSKGLFYFQTPDSVRWEYTSPIKSVLLMQKGSIKRYTQGSRGLVEDASGSLESMQIVLQEIGRWTRGQFTENEHFSATLKGGKGARIILTPKEKGLASMISRIVITLSPDRQGVIKSVKIIESEGNYTLFEFNDVQINRKISETLFREVG